MPTRASPAPRRWRTSTRRCARQRHRLPRRAHPPRARGARAHPAKAGRRAHAAQRFFHDYLTRYTNAAALVSRRVSRRGGRGRRLLRLRPGDVPMTQSHSAVRNGWASRDATDATGVLAVRSRSRLATDFTELGGSSLASAPRHARTQRLRRDAASTKSCGGTTRRYTPEMVEQVLRHAAPDVRQGRGRALSNSGPDSSSAVCYAVGWTQHTTGVQMIRAAAILQLLLGNIGRPGGGILALRGHATIQGSTDIATLLQHSPRLSEPTPSALPTRPCATTCARKRRPRRTGPTCRSSSSASSRPGSATRPRRPTTTATPSFPRSSATTRTCR